jgi:predicted XRE-type DNA-binding protein
MLIKAQLMTKIAELIKRKGLTQTQAGHLLGLPQPKVSALLRGNFRGVSERRLLDCLTRLGSDVQVVVKAAPRPSSFFQSRGAGSLLPEPVPLLSVQAFRATRAPNKVAWPFSAPVMTMRLCI